MMHENPERRREARELALPVDEQRERSHDKHRSATGAVGVEMIKTLEKRNFPFSSFISFIFSLLL